MKGLLPIDFSKMLLANAQPLYSYQPCDDIDAFQSLGRNELKKLLGIDIIEAGYVEKDIEIEYDKFADDLMCREIGFTVESEADIFTPCSLFIPTESIMPPLIVALHGHSTGVHTCLGRTKYTTDESTIKEQRCDFAKQAINNGYAVLTLEHRGFGERGGDEKGARCSEPALRSLLLGRTLLGERVWDTLVALSAVIKSFGHIVDTKRIAVLGYSGGGTIGTYLSAIDQRIKAAVIVSAISTVKASIGAMPHCPCNYVPSIAKYFDMGNICQLIAPRHLAVISGKDDPIFPIIGAYECMKIAKVAYEKLNANNMLRHISAYGGHKFYPMEAWKIIKEIL